MPGGRANLKEQPAEGGLAQRCGTQLRPSGGAPTVYGPLCHRR